MLQMCPKLPGQQFVDPPFEEEILTFIRELVYSRNIKLLSDVKVHILPQPWRTFGTIINKCLSGKEDLVFQIENKESWKTKYMFYPRFTKVIINHFMSQDQSIPRRNKVDWHMANDDPILITMRFIPQHEVVQKYGDSKSEVMHRRTPRRRLYKHLKLLPVKESNLLLSSQPSSSGAHERTGVTPGVPGVPTYRSNDEQISWKSSDEEDDNDESNKIKKKIALTRVQTPSHVESTDDEEIQGTNVEGDKQDEEETNEEVEANELYRDVNVNLEGRDIEITNA
ncbi:hypothetical protein Tco_1060958 [Tanacetum coccineum]